MNYYNHKSNQLYQLSHMCGLAVMSMLTLMIVAIFNGLAMWAIICGAGTLFAWIGMRCFREDAAIYRRRADDLKRDHSERIHRL